MYGFSTSRMYESARALYVMSRILKIIIITTIIIIIIMMSIYIPHISHGLMAVYNSVRVRSDVSI